MILIKRIMYALERPVSRMLGLNLYIHSVTGRHSNTKAFLHLTFQLLIMVLSLGISYIFPYTIQKILTLYMPVNDVTIVISVILLIGSFILALIIPLVIGYYYNKFALKQLKF